MNLRKVTMKYYRMVVLIPHDPAEIWGFRYGLTLGIGTLKLTASTRVFMRMICALRCSISCDARTSSMILVFSTYKKNILSSPFFYLDIENPLGRAALGKFKHPM